MYFLQEKESLITELRKELRLSNEEHRELLGQVNADDTIRRIRSDGVQYYLFEIFGSFDLFCLLMGHLLGSVGSGDKQAGFNLACTVLVKVFMIQYPVLPSLHLTRGRKLPSRSLLNLLVGPHHHFTHSQSPHHTSHLHRLLNEDLQQDPRARSINL